MRLSVYRVRVALKINKSWSAYLNRYFELKWGFEFPPDWRHRNDESPLSKHWHIGFLEVAHYLRPVTRRDLILTEELAERSDT